MKKLEIPTEKSDKIAQDKAFRIEIGKRISIKIKEKKWDQADLAIRLEMDRTRLNRWIKGRNNYEPNDLKKIAAELSTTVAYLMGEKESGFEVVDMEDKAFHAYKILKGLDPKIQSHYLFVFDAIEHHARSKKFDPSL